MPLSSGGTEHRQLGPERQYTLPPGVPSAGLFQISFSLSEASFLKLTQGSPALLAIGASMIGLGLTSGLPILVDHYFLHPSPEGVLSDTNRANGIAAGMFVVVGIACVGFSSFASYDRWKLMKRIKQHFKENLETPVEPR